MTVLSDHAAEHQRILDENAELRCRIDELIAEREELLDRIEELEWEHKDDRPQVLEKAIAG